jgi:hypothetical protein
MQHELSALKVSVLSFLVLLVVGSGAAAPQEQAPPLPPSQPVLEGSFATGQVCAQCHSNAPEARAMRDSQGRDLAPYDLWKRSMMANAARDPFWLAVVSAEVAATPSMKHEIEGTCTRCHMPMASEEVARGIGGKPGTALLGKEGALGDLARDGVSCTVCHQIEDNGLGGPRSFSGLFRIGKDRVIYGPHEDVFPRPMMMHTGYTPEAGEQILDPGMCATCHTLFTSALTPKGEPAVGILPEQTPFLEWQNSKYGRSGRTCQDCHMPTEDSDGKAIETAIARTPGGWDFGFAEPRRPFGQHRFTGANYAVPQIIAALNDEMNPNADEAELTLYVADTIRYLQEETADIELGEPLFEGRSVTVPVKVSVRTGHKFPTGHPSRRAWIRFQVRSADGKSIFTSGDYDDLGRLLNGKGKVLGSDTVGGGIQSHRNLIDSSGQVQVYESTMADTDGKPVWLLTRGVSYIKDNRILPQGWQTDHPAAARIAPSGVKDDPDFVAGGDVVRYRFKLPASGGPYQVKAELLYQPIGGRYLQELLKVSTPDVDRFRRGYLAVRPKPVTIASVTGPISRK